MFIFVLLKSELDLGLICNDIKRSCKDEGGTLVPMFAQILEANSDKIGHGPISGHMEADGQRNAERWWFKS